jgi:hypothetical protein
MEGVLERSGADRHDSNEWPCELEMNSVQLVALTASFQGSIGQTYDEKWPTNDAKLRSAHC